MKSLLISAVNLWEERTSGCGFHIWTWAPSTVSAALWSQWRAESEIQAICWHTDAEWLQYSSFTFQFILVASSDWEIRSCHLYSQKKQMKISMRRTFKVAAGLNFDLFELYFLLHQMDPSLSSSPTEQLFYIHCYLFGATALNSFDHMCGKQPIF